MCPRRRRLFRQPVHRDEVRHVPGFRKLPRPTGNGVPSPRGSVFLAVSFLVELLATGWVGPEGSSPSPRNLPRIFRPFFFYSSSAKLIWRPWKVYPRCPAPLVFETKIGSKSHTHTQTRLEGRKEGKTAAGGQPGDADGNLGGVGCWGLVA